MKFYLSPNFELPLSIDKFPVNGEDIKDWAEGSRFTLKQLMLQDRLQKETLKDVVLKVEQRFGANSSPDTAFDEIFKLIFTKLYDEKLSSDDADLIASDINRHHIKLADIDDSEFRTMEFRAKEIDNASDVFESLTPFVDSESLTKDVIPSCLIKSIALSGPNSVITLHATMFEDTSNASLTVHKPVF